MYDNLEYWEAVIAQHEKHLEIAMTKSEINDLDVRNSKLAIEEAKQKIEELK